LAFLCFSGAVTSALAADKKQSAASKQSTKQTQAKTQKGKAAEPVAAEPVATNQVMVLSFNGPKKQTVQKRAMDAMIAAAIEVTTQGESATPRNAPEFAALAKETRVKAFLTCDINMSQKGWEMKSAVRAGEDGSVVSEFALKAGWLPGLLKQIDKEFAPAVQAALDKIRASEEQVQEIDLEPAPAGPTPEELAEAEKPKEEEEPESTERPSPLEAGVYLGLVVRNWTPKDSIFGQVLGQKDAGMPSARLAVGIYPGAFLTGGFLADFGLTGSLESSLAAKTRNANGGTSNMYHSDYWIALRYRVRASEHEIGFSGGLGRQSMSIDLPRIDSPTMTGVDISPSTYLPDVTYNYVRLGVDSVLRFGDLSLSLGAAYRPVSSLDDARGQVAHVDWFPKAEANGVELGLGLGYSITDSIGLVVKTDYRRYGFNFHRKPEDQLLPQPVAGGPVPVAGGATDTYFGGWLGAVYRIPEKK
jgi:hypothetical protein